MTKKKLIPLHMLFLLYSICGVLGKLAAHQAFFSSKFFILYGGSLIILVIYSLLWQRMLLKMPLTIAFSNKGVTVIWGIIWGVVFFDERINLAKVIAATLIITGVAIIGKANE